MIKSGIFQRPQCNALIWLETGRFFRFWTVLGNHRQKYYKISLEAKILQFLFIIWINCLAQKIWRNSILGRKSSGRILRGQSLKLLVTSCFLSVTRPKPQLRQFAIGTLNHATWDVYSPKAVGTLIYGYSFLYCIWNIFSSVLWKRWIRSEYWIHWKRYCVNHGMRWCCSFHFRYVTNKIAFSLKVYFAGSDGHWFICNFASISCEFRQLKWINRLCHWSEFRYLKENEIFAKVNNWACPYLQGLRH